MAIHLLVMVERQNDITVANMQKTRGISLILSYMLWLPRVISACPN